MDLRAEKFLLEVFDSITDPLAVFDLEYRIFKVNRAMSDLCNIPPEQLVGRYCYDALFGRAQLCEGCHAVDVFDSGEACTQEIELSFKGGPAHSINVYCQPVIDPKGKTVRIIQHMRDMGGRERSEGHRKEREDTIQALLSVYQESSMLLEPDGEIVAINRVGAERLGVSVEEAMGKRLFDLLAPEVAEFRRARLSQVFRTGKHFDFDDEHEGRSYSHDIYPVLDSQGKATRAAFFSRDVTKHRRKERALASEQQRLFNLLDKLPGVVYIVAPDYSIRFSNIYFRELFGEPKEKRCYELIWGREEPCKECNAFRVFNGNSAVEWKWTDKGGRTYQMYNYPFIDTDGSTLALELGVDITHLKKLEDELRSASGFRKKIIDSITSPLTVIDPNTYHILQANEPFLARVGLEASETLERPCYEVILGRDAPCDRDGIHCPVKEAAINKSTSFSDKNYCDASGQKKIIQVITYPVLDKNDKVDLVIRMERDIIDEAKMLDVFDFKDKELEKTRFQLGALFQIPQQVREKASLKELLEFIHDKTLKVFPDSVPLFFILDAESRDLLSLKGCIREVREPLDGILQKLKEEGLDREFIQYLSKIKEFQIVSSLERPDIPRFLHMVTEGYPSWFGLPIITQQNCVGYFVLGSKKSEDFPRDDLKFFGTLISQVASFIRHLVFYDAEIDHSDTVLVMRSSYEEIIGRSQIMQEVYELIDLVARSDATVLITGENGTGKELVSQAIHNKSDRKSGPFVVANCSAYSATLLESELFGHEKGAFTGAIRQKKGRIERANGGTLFLDEIGDIAPATQVLLLRFLQDHLFERVGGEITIKADVRVLVATNRNLYNEVEAGKFREDLYYRINVITIHLPPLRKRREDIPLLSRHFLEKFNLKEGKNIRRFSPNAIKELMRYDWPGNVRQLENAISHAVIITKGSVIRRRHLPRFLQESVEDSSTTSLSESERRLILKVLEESNWNKHEAARRLKVSRSTLYSKIRRYRLEKGRTSV